MLILFSLTEIVVRGILSKLSSGNDVYQIHPDISEIIDLLVNVAERASFLCSVKKPVEKLVLPWCCKVSWCFCNFLILNTTVLVISTNFLQGWWLMLLVFNQMWNSFHTIVKNLNIFEGIKALSTTFHKHCQKYKTSLVPNTLRKRMCSINRVYHYLINRNQKGSRSWQNRLA